MLQGTVYPNLAGTALQALRGNVWPINVTRAQDTPWGDQHNTKRRLAGVLLCLQRSMGFFQRYGVHVVMAKFATGHPKTWTGEWVVKPQGKPWGKSLFLRADPKRVYDDTPTASRRAASFALTEEDEQRHMQRRIITCSQQLTEALACLHRRDRDTVEGTTAIDGIPHKKEPEHEEAAAAAATEAPKHEASEPAPAKRKRKASDALKKMHNDE